MDKVKINQFEMPSLDTIVKYKESEEGEEKSATVGEIISEKKSEPVWMKLTAKDKYGNPVYIWRPVSIRIIGFMQMPETK